MLEPILCGPPKWAPLFPKLRGHFAEFLNNASPVGLRILSSSTCVGLRYGLLMHYSGFSRHTDSAPSLLLFAPRHVFALSGDLIPDSYLAWTGISSPAALIRMCPRSSDIKRCRNLNRLSISYAFLPHLRSRLSRRRSALRRKPWIFGRKDSHLPLATHSGILSSIYSTAPYGTASPHMQCSSTNPCGFLSFGAVFQPRTFSAQDLSTSELLRTL